MNTEEIEALLARQRAYYKSGATLPVKFRIACLCRLYDAILAREEEIAEALKADLGKSAYESYMCEIGMTLSEITYFKKNVKKLAKRKRVRTPLAQFPAKSYRQPVPFGNVLVMSPWNYPFFVCDGSRSGCRCGR